MLQVIRELVKRRDLLYLLTWREVKIRYKQSVMGMLWAVLMPLVIVCSGLVVRYALSRVSGRPIEISDLTSVAVKSVPWAFFVSAVRFGTNSLIGNISLVTKIYMPRLAFPISAVVSQLIDFLVAGTVVVILLIVAQTGVSVHLFWVPAILGCLILLAISCAIILSAASLFLRDVKYIVDVLLTFAIFFTPVFYESSLFGEWAPLILLNPMAPLLEAISATVIFHQTPSLPWMSYSLTFTGLLCAAALFMFTRLEPLFAENV